MTSYTYTLEYKDNRGLWHKVGMGTQRQMMNTAVAIDRQGGTLLDAMRETWNTDNGVATLYKVERYSMGKPTITLWERGS